MTVSNERHRETVAVANDFIDEIHRLEKERDEARALAAKLAATLQSVLDQGREHQRRMMKDAISVLAEAQEAGAREWRPPM